MKTISVFALAVLFWMSPAHAQSVHLAEAQWKAVAGIYQHWDNSDMNIRFEVHSDTLVAQPLWAEFKPILLQPSSPLEFHGVEAGERGSFRVSFKRDSSGRVNEVMINGNDQWLRNNHYRPLVRKEMAHTPEQIRPFEGLYQMDGRDGRFARLFERDNRLIMNELGTGGGLPFVMQSALSFYLLPNPLATMDFSKDSSGRIVRMVFFKQQFWTRVNTVRLTRAEIQPFEGKYQSKDDPDNLLQLIARDSNLVVKQVWDGKEIVLTPLTDTYFYNETESYPLQVLRGTNGKVNSILILSSQEFVKVPE